MPVHQLNALGATRVRRREFMWVVGSAAAGGTLLATVAGCWRDTPATITEADGTMGFVRGSVVDAGGALKPVGRIFLLAASGLNNGVFADVGSTGTFDFGKVKIGAYQLQYWGANLARVPEPLPNPVPITVRAGSPTVVTFRIEAADEDEMMDRDINAGDFFFQEQPSGEPNATVVVKLGAVVCWYNVGSMLHTVSGGPWGDSGPLAHGDNFEWRATQAGTFEYRCKYHVARMLATLKVEP
jgi:plastocyanin